MLFLRTKRLRLAALDAESMRLLVGDRRALEERLGVKITHLELEESQRDAMRRALQKIVENDDHYLWHTNWEIILKDENRIVGGIGFKNHPNQGGGDVEIGYGIYSPEDMSKGYMTEAAQELVNWAFTFDFVKAITAETEEDNVGSHRVLEKLGLKKIDEKENKVLWKLNK
jgi:ribosomal-protein-alanine N-acetyltransferase